VASAVDRGQPLKNKTAAPALHGTPRLASDQALASGPQETRGGDTKPPPAMTFDDTVFVRSYVVRKGEAIVTLTNGRQLTKATGLLLLTPDYAFTRSGARYQVLRGGRAPAEGASAPAPASAP